MLPAAPSAMFMAFPVSTPELTPSSVLPRLSSYRAPVAALDSIPISHLTPDQQSQFRALSYEFADIFAEDSNFFGRTSVSQHRIPLYKEMPVKQRDRFFAPTKSLFLEAEIERLLALGVIRPSESPWASQVVIVDKPGGDMRLCVDYRLLNEQTIPDAYPLPRIDDLLHELNGSKYYTSLDLTSGFWQVEMDPDDAAKTAFRALGELYEFTVMPFGLENAPATFQRLMNKVLKPVRHCAGVYIDDVLVRSPTWEQHLQDLRDVFTCLRKAGLRLSIKKCYFGEPHVRFLGFIISESGISPDKSKVQAMEDFPTPNSVKQLRSFLGTTGFYRRFIENYSKIVNPLNALLAKNRPFEWTDRQQRAFDELKKHMVSAPILGHPDLNKPFTLYTDASYLGLGAILGQKDEQGRERVIEYASRTLNKHELNYAPTELECLGVVWAVNKFAKYLCIQKFDVYTDHQALTSLLNKKHTNNKFIRWVLQLQEFNFNTLYRKGSDNRADSLSRAYEVTPAMFAAFTANAKQKPSKEVTVLGIKYRETPKGLRRIPSPEDIPMLLQDYHADPACGHFKIGATSKRIKERFWWPNMDADIRNYVQACDPCQRKDPPQITHELHPIPVGGGPFNRWGIDIMGPLPAASNGGRYIIVAIDYFTKWPEARVLDNIRSETVAQFIFEDVICRFGVPKVIQTDNGKSFNNRLIHAMTERFGTRYSQVIAYHPQSNGLVERFNRTLGTALAKFVQAHTASWDKFVMAVLMAYRLSVQSSTRFSPYRLCFGLNGRLPVDLTWLTDEIDPDKDKPETLIGRAVQILSRLEPDRFQALENIKKAQEKQKKFHDRPIAEPITYKEGDKVLVLDSEKLKRHDAKLLPKWLGPYSIRRALRNNTYIIYDQDDRPYHRSVHGDQLKLYKELPYAPVQVILDPATDIPATK
jgi:hypothetical protein